MIIFTILGIISVVFQLVIFREFTFSIAKNELAFVLAAGMWLIFCSLGSIWGRRKQFISPAWMGPASALVFCLALSLIHLSKDWFGLAYYETASIVFVFISAAVFIGIVSFTIGYLFAAFTNSYLKKNGLGEDVYARFFAWEAAGFFIGGVIFSFWLSSYINPFIFSSLPLILTLSLLLSNKVKTLSLFGIVVVAVSFSLLFPKMLVSEFKGANIEKLSGSHYGPIFLTDANGSKSLYANGSLISSSEDNSWNEAFIHTSMAAAPGAKDILYIGLSSSEQILQILKYPHVQLDCLEINPVLSELTAGGVPKSLHKRINFIVDDPRVYIEKSQKRYDLIIMNMPAPSTLALNRYFTLEFFHSVRQTLDERGVFSFFIPSKADILSPQILRFDSCIVNTAKKVFDHALFIPGDSMLVLAAYDVKLSSGKIIQHFTENNVKTEYFTIYHLRDYLDAGRMYYVRDMIDTSIDINQDLFPRGFLYYLLLEQRKFYPNFAVNILGISHGIVYVGFILLIIVGLLGLYREKISQLLNVGILGSISIGMTAIIFLLFQLYSGALFWKMGILIGLFMVGVSIGTFFINKTLTKYELKRSTVALLFITWSIFGAGIFAGSYFGGVLSSEATFYLYAFLTGALTGAGYPIFTRCLLRASPRKNVAVSVYAADLTGAFLGTLAFSVFLIPFLGIKGAIFAAITAALIFSIKNIFG